MRIRPTATLAAATASLVILSGVTYAAVQSVDPNPDAQVVIPNLHTASPHPSRGAQRSRGHGKDDPTAHDSADNHGTGGQGNGSHSAEPGDDSGRARSGSGHDRDKGEPGGEHPGSKPSPRPTPGGGGDKGGGGRGGKPTPHPSPSGGDDNGGGGRQGGKPTPTPSATAGGDEGGGHGGGHDG
jgi:hypothetical protein